MTWFTMTIIYLTRMVVVSLSYVLSKAPTRMVVLQIHFKERELGPDPSTSCICIYMPQQGRVPYNVCCARRRTVWQQLKCKLSMLLVVLVFMLLRCSTNHDDVHGMIRSPSGWQHPCRSIMVFINPKSLI